MEKEIKETVTDGKNGARMKGKRKMPEGYQTAGTGVPDYSLPHGRGKS